MAFFTRSKNNLSGRKSKLPKKVKIPIIIAAVILIIVIFSIAVSNGGDYYDYGSGSIPRPETNFISYSDSINFIEVNQSLSFGYDTDTGDFYPMENFAAGKETAVFVTLNEPFKRGTETYLIINRDEDFVAELLPEIIDSHTLLFQPANMASVNNWEAGEYVMEFRMGGSRAVRVVQITKTQPLKILAVPVKANYSGRIVRCSGDWRKGAQLITATFPVAKGDIEFILGPELDLSDRRYDLNTNDGLYNVWEALNNLQTRNRDYHLIKGFIRDSAGGGEIMGYTFGAPSSITSESSIDFLETVVHEIAHVFEIGDEYDGGSLNLQVNSPPYGMEGHDISTNRNVVAHNELVVGGEELGLDGVGSVIYPEQRPYWVEGRKFLRDMTSYMGSGIEGIGSFPYMWTTSDKWNHLFHVLTGQISLDGFGGGGYKTVKEGRNTKSEQTVQRNEEPVKVINITGHFNNRGNFVSDPWYSYETEAGFINTGKTGNYSVSFYDTQGSLISAGYFDVDSRSQINSANGQQYVDLGRIPIDIIVPFPENSARIVLGKGAEQIYSRTVSKTTPTVAFTGLADYQQLGNTVTLNWEAGGETDRLYFEVWYSPYEDSWYLLGSNITGRSLNVDLSGFPGTDEGYFYIYATDGARTGEAESPWVKIPYKAPEIYYEQETIPEFKLTEEITFDPDIYDLQDGWLYDDDVVWTLDGREFLTGNILWVWPYELAPGTHTFTVKAANSAGMITQKEYSFTILDDESDLPNDWSREYIKAALSDGFVLPLNNIDAPISRRHFATLMTNLFDWMLEEDYDWPEYAEGIVTDCGADDYDQFFMVHLGVMDAPKGLFFPNRRITEREAALIMYRVSRLADPDYFIKRWDWRILRYFIKEGIHDKSGPNTFNAKEHLTNRLALVRLAKMIKAVFTE